MPAAPFGFQPPRIYVLTEVRAHRQAARRAHRVTEACPMPPPIAILGLFEFDAQKAAETAARMRAAGRRRICGC